MHNRTTLKRHANLVDQMATTLDVDLEEQTLRGNLPFDALSDMVLKCTACTDPTGCQHWLDQNAKATQTPSYCRNSTELDRLRD